MGKRDNYTKQLQPLINDINNINKLENFLVSESNLPSRRANLELAYSFADCFQILKINDIQWNLLNKWIDLSIKDASVDNPKEFLPFCAIQTFGSLYPHCDTKRKEYIINILKSYANDKRWRIREAVAMAFQRIAENNFIIINEIFSNWIVNATLLEKRAIIATLAHPPILDNKDNVLFCLQITEEILTHIHTLNKDIRKTEDYRVLKKGLEYAISVFVEKLPLEGFVLLQKWGQIDDVDIKRIVTSNLGKARLTKKYLKDVNDVLAIL